MTSLEGDIMLKGNKDELSDEAHKGRISGRLLVDDLHRRRVVSEENDASVG